MKIGIIVAQYEEAEYIINKLGMKLVARDIYTSLGNVLIISDVGMLNAMYASEILIHEYDIKIIINLGVAAGRGSLKIHDVICITSVYNGDFDISKFNHPKYYNPGVGNFISLYVDNEGRYLNYESVKCLPCFSISQFLEGNIDTSIENYVVDMELYAIAYTCLKSNVKLISIKVISDTDESNSLVEYKNNLDSCSEILGDISCKLFS